MAHDAWRTSGIFLAPSAGRKETNMRKHKDKHRRPRSRGKIAKMLHTSWIRFDDLPLHLGKNYKDEEEYVGRIRFR